MILLHPEWLALFPILLLAGWGWPRLGLFKPLRLLLLGLLTFSLAQPQWQKQAEGVDLWLLLDSSVSAEEPMAKGLPEWEKLLEQSRGPQDHLHQLAFAGEVMKPEAEGATLYDHQRQATRTALAINQALAHVQKESAGRPARLLIFTDGYATEPLSGVAEKLIQQGVELDMHLARQNEVTDYRIAALRTPTKAQLGEPFLLEVEVRGSQDGRVPLKLLRQGREITAAQVDVRLGTGIARFTDRSNMAGVIRYEAVIQPAEDAHLGNNQHQALVEIAGGPRVLLLTAYTDDPLTQILQQQGFTVDLVTDLHHAQPGQLTGARCVILNNVPAFELNNDFLDAIDFYVREQGGSLLMAGGQKSFGAGGYFESAIDSLLPVSMELKQEHRKLMVAMGIVLDRSGSMSMTVQNGFSKMSLADEGAANAVRFLGPQDLLTVFAVDSEAHVMVPLQPVGPNRDKMESAIRRIESTGGGIFVYEGLKAAWDELKNAAAGQRHIILFSDAADSEHPGDYKKLLAEITTNGGTVSVIALGTRQDPDARLLEDIAKLGKGRIFFTDRAEELPSIFSQETVTVARSAFVQDPVKTKAISGWLEITSQSLNWLGEVDGYNLSYARDWASQALISQDEYATPLVAFGQRGIGRTAAVSFPLGGPFSERVRAWPAYGDFLQTLTRWLMGESLPPGIGLKHRLQGTTLTLDLLHDESWEAPLMARAPRLVLAQGLKGTPQEIAWERQSPGHYQAKIDLPEGEMVRGAVQLNSQALAFGPALVGKSTEWAFDEARTDELRQVVQASGGRELLELSQAWRSPDTDRFVDLRNELLLFTLGLMLFEAFVTRTGWRLPKFSLPVRKTRLASAKSPTPATVHQKRLAKPSDQPSPTEASKNSTPPIIQAEPQVDRQSRFDRAKRRSH
ncbi:von Willebrand factor type A domain-containing protein [Prosthecobacter debontii]|uniref:von Willebrand factor type A domain-containing protein n=1 Tax=Prosthecobacter debontii TaxID=48467 RepID=A0A1T4WTI6_9BACT|nr:VWA domain-containing protein [Prosthecobacter debontii]SKA79921.1 von Willebrand factor type A domain-containing protein [Prosthecobacter debontii]